MQANSEVSMFKGFNAHPESKALLEVLNKIKNGQYQKDVLLEIRDCQELGKDYSSLKRSLFGFTPSAIFKNSRNIDDVLCYTHFIVLDIDKIEKGRLMKIRNIVVEDEHTFATFVSPSGIGLKILVKVDSDIDMHQFAFKQVKEYYESLLGVEIDKSGKDVTRLCFVSYDPELYLNPISKVFSIIKLIEDKFAKAMELTENSFKFKEGQRNNFIYTLGCYCNQMGLPKKDALKRMLGKYGQGENDEYVNAVNSAYSKSLPPLDGLMNQTDPIERYLHAKYDFRFNLVRGEVESKSKFEEDFIPMTDRQLHSILRDLKLNDLSISKNKLIELLESDFTPEFHPMREYLNGLPKWDEKTDYLADLASRVKTDDDVFFKIAFKRWFVGMIACAIEPNATNHLALIFSGSQGIGKSTFIRQLLPPQLSKYHYSGMIDPKSKDTLIHLAECFIIDLDELSSLTRRESSDVKELITKDKVRVRRPYGKISEDLKRRASFIGSINDDQFLTDTTGNRRFLCFRVNNIDFLSSVDYEGVYCQALALYNEGFKYYFDQEESHKINERNEGFRRKNLIEDLVDEYVPARDLGKADFYLNAGDFLQFLHDSKGVQLGETNNITLGKIMSKRGFKKVKKDGREVYAIDERKGNQASHQLQLAS